MKKENEIIENEVNPIEQILDENNMEIVGDEEVEQVVEAVEEEKIENEGK